MTKRHRVNRKRLPSGAAFARVIARKVKNKLRRMKQGLVIGHTTSGKPIYSRKTPHSYAGFTAEDHADASWEHGDYAQRAGNEKDRKHHTDMRNQHVNAVVSTKYNEERNRRK